MTPKNTGFTFSLAEIIIGVHFLFIAGQIVYRLGQQSERDSNYL
jgi:hypothetical protein